MLLPPPLPTTSTGTGEVEEAGDCSVYPLFGQESDEERVKFCERMVEGEIHKNLWVVTAAHVVCSKLTMPTGDFDAHIAAMKAAAISGDYSKIVCRDRIESIIELNARTDVCCLYSATTDVALLRLPPMINRAATKLHVSANSGHWKLWHTEGLKFAADDPLITVVKVGAKTGITVGILQSMSDTTTDTKSSAIYKNCIRVKTVCGKFCKSGDSGAIYFALLENENPSHSDCDVLDWLPIAIHRTSDEEYSYGTPLKNAIQSLIDAKKLPEDLNIKMLHQVVDMLTPVCKTTIVDASTVEKFSNIL